MKRSSFILIGLAIILAIVTFFVLRQPGEQSLGESAAGPLLTYDSAAVDKMEIVSSGGIVVLEKQGGRWMVTSPLNYPANEATITSAVGKAKDLKITNLVSSNPSKQTVYAVDSTATLVHIYTNNKQVASFRVGKPTSTWTETFVRKEGSNDVYSVEGMLSGTFLASASDWRDKTIFKADQNQIKQVKFDFAAARGADTVFVLSKKDSINWEIGTEPASTPNVTGFLSTISNLQTDEFIDSTITALPKLVVTIELQNIQLRFYRSSDNKYYAQKSGSPQWFALQDWHANQIVKRKKDFVQQK